MPISSTPWSRMNGVPTSISVGTPTALAVHREVPVRQLRIDGDRASVARRAVGEQQRVHVRQHVLDGGEQHAVVGVRAAAGCRDRLGSSCGCSRYTTWPLAGGVHAHRRRSPQPGRPARSSQRDVALHDLDVALHRRRVAKAGHALAHPTGQRRQTEHRGHLAVADDLHRLRRPPSAGVGSSRSSKRWRIARASMCVASCIRNGPAGLRARTVRLSHLLQRREAAADAGLEALQRLVAKRAVDEQAGLELQHRRIVPGEHRPHAGRRRALSTSASRPSDARSAARR